MKRQRKKYERPRQPWDKERIERERELMKNFGLKTKQEIWVTASLLRKFRRFARGLAAKKDEEREKILVDKVIRLGLLQQGADLDDVLGLTLENILERRLQTVLVRKGLARTPKQARQFIVHGKVRIGEKRIKYPSYIVEAAEESQIKVEGAVVKPAETTQ